MVNNTVMKQITLAKLVIFHIYIVIIFLSSNDSIRFTKYFAG